VERISELGALIATSRLKQTAKKTSFFIVAAVKISNLTTKKSDCDLFTGRERQTAVASLPKYCHTTKYSFHVTVIFRATEICILDPPPPSLYPRVTTQEPPHRFSWHFSIRVVFLHYGMLKRSVIPYSGTVLKKTATNIGQPFRMHLE
jgi:hypothetical protein